MTEKLEITQETQETQVASPNDLIQLAIEKGSDLEKIEKLLEIKIKYEENEAKKAYVKAMAEFKANPPKIIKDRTVSYSGANYKHASLGNVTEQINNVLSKYGLNATWATKQNGEISVTCKVTHQMGHSEETTLSAPADKTGSKNTIQAIGSTVTYLQRYTLLSICGLATYDQDDDGVTGASEFITQEQAIEIDTLVNESGADAAKVLEFAKADSYNTILAKDYMKVKNPLLDRKAKSNVESK